MLSTNANGWANAEGLRSWAPFSIELLAPWPASSSTPWCLSNRKGNKRLQWNFRAVSLFSAALAACIPLVAQGPKDPITLDEFMNATEIKEVKLSPDGSAAVMATVSPDWQHSRFRSELWIWKEKKGETSPLTRSGHARSPQWSPNGRYIAFLSDLPLPDGEDKDSNDVPERLWLIAVDSGESFALYKEKLKVHAFAWSPDGGE